MSYKLTIELDIGDLSLPGDNSKAIARSRAIHKIIDMNLVYQGKPRWDGIPITILLTEHEHGADVTGNLLGSTHEAVSLEKLIEHSITLQAKDDEDAKQ